MSVAMVIPTLGERPDYLSSCVKSIVDTQEEIHVCLVAPAHRVPDLQTAFPGMMVVAQKSCGLAAAISEGWNELPPAEFRAWLGDDDLLTPGSLHTAASALRARRDAPMAYGRAIYIDELGRPLLEARPGRRSRYLLRMGQNLVLQPGSLYRSSAVERIGGLDPHMRFAFDVDLHRRLLDLGRPVYIPKVLGVVRTHPTSLTKAFREQSVEEAEAALRAAMRRVPSWAQDMSIRLAQVAARASSRISSRIIRCD